jgi:hypothetical protein
MKTALEMIVEERERQITVEGFDAAHDAAHPDMTLNRAARCYEHAARVEFLTGQPILRIPSPWPWDKENWKPYGGVVRMLVKAGALHQAEFDRARGAIVGDAPTARELSFELPRICMMIDRVRAMTTGLGAETIRVLKELRAHHQQIVNEFTVTMRIHNSAMEEERHAARLHESFVETIDKILRTDLTTQEETGH